jgi:hypothetical protein
MFLHLIFLAHGLLFGNVHILVRLAVEHHVFMFFHVEQNVQLAAARTLLAASCSFSKGMSICSFSCFHLLAEHFQLSGNTPAFSVFLQEHY